MKNKIGRLLVSSIVWLSTAKSYADISFYQSLGEISGSVDSHHYKINVYPNLGQISGTIDGFNIEVRFYSNLGNINGSLLCGGVDITAYKGLKEVAGILCGEKINLRDANSKEVAKDIVIDAIAYEFPAEYRSKVRKFLALRITF